MADHCLRAPQQYINIKSTTDATNGPSTSLPVRFVMLFSASASAADVATEKTKVNGLK